MPQLHRMLGEEYARLEKKDESIRAFDLAAEMFMDVGENEQAMKTINMLLRLEPANADEYRKVLAQIQSS